MSASRFLLAALWLIAFRAGDRAAAIMLPLSLAGAASDFLDGRIARWVGSTSAFGQWLDALADIVFVLAAISCASYAGAIPVYIPLLIGASFSQYAIDSVMLRGSPVPVKSRIGHWGGVVNYAIVIALSVPRPQVLGTLLRAMAPFLATFYVAAIVERAITYPHRHQQRT